MRRLGTREYWMLSARLWRWMTLKKILIVLQKTDMKIIKEWLKKTISLEIWGMTEMWKKQRRYGRERVTMSYNETGTHKKRRIAHPWVFRGTASAPFVPAQDLRAHGNSLSPHPRPLSTAVLARTIGKLPKHHASASAKSRDVNSTGDLAATLLESALASNPTLTGEVSATLAPCLSRHGQPAATLLKRKETVAWCAS